MRATLVHLQFGCAVTSSTASRQPEYKKTSRSRVARIAKDGNAAKNWVLTQTESDREFWAIFADLRKVAVIDGAPFHLREFLAEPRSQVFRRKWELFESDSLVRLLTQNGGISQPKTSSLTQTQVRTLSIGSYWQTVAEKTGLSFLDFMTDFVITS